MNNNNTCTCLFFIPAECGGAEKVSINIANILKRKGISIRVVFLKDSANTIINYLDNNIPYDVVEANNKIARYYGIFKYIRRYRPRTVFASLTALSTILIINKLFFRNLRVITRQCFMPFRGSRIVNTSIKYLFRFADTNIAQTLEAKQSMMETYGLAAGKIIVINNPIDTKDITQKIQNVTRPDGNYFRYIAIGRINPIKGFDILIKSFAKVKEKHPKATLRIIGNISDERYYLLLKRLVKDLHVEESVEISGYTDNPYKELIISNCFVLSSLTETLPNVMLESMYLNLPVAASTCIPVVSHTIKDGVNGYLAPVGDVDSLAKAMEKSALLYGKIDNINSNEEIERRLIGIFDN